MTKESAELTCQELVELVTDYLEGAMPRTERARFEEHLAICEGCTEYLRQVRTTIEVIGALTEESIPAPARDRLLETFRHWKVSRGMEAGEPTT
jgi:predicted anti-sigma-YlaC factor YlaD